MDLAEGQERSELDHCLHFSLEQHGEHEDVARRGLSKARRDPDVIFRNVREQNRLLLQCRLADESLAEVEAVADVLALPVRVARNELEHRRVVVVVHDVERAVVSRDERRELRHDELRHRFQILLSLHHPRELREVRLQPVLFRILFGRGLQVHDHLVEVVLQLVQLALSLHRDLPAQVAAGHRRRDVRDRSHLQRQAVRHCVHVVGERSPRAGRAGHFRLAAELSLSAHFLGDARHFVSEDTERVHHRVDGVLELENLTTHFDGDLLREVSLGDCRRHEGDVSDLARQVSGERIHVVCEILPRTSDAGHVRLPAQLSFRSHVARDSRHLG